MMALRLILFLIVASIQVFPAAPAAGEPGGLAPAAGPTLASLRGDRHRQEELLGFARTVFLARLGLGAGTSAPTWARGIQKACFVTFFSGGRVVACAGGFHPRTSDLGREIEENVRQALRLDPRAARIDRRTALAARVLITFPGEPRPIGSYEDVDPHRQGLFVENERGGVAIVPGEAKTASYAYRSALARLNEKSPEAVRLYVFDAWGINLNP